MNLDEVAVSFFAVIVLFAMLFVTWFFLKMIAIDIKPHLDQHKIFGRFRFLDGETIIFPKRENFISDNLLFVKTTSGRTVLMPNPGTSYVNGEHAGIVIDDGILNKIRGE